jgi:hypothetical protein
MDVGVPIDQHGRPPSIDAGSEILMNVVRLVAAKQRASWPPHLEPSIGRNVAVTHATRQEELTMGFGRGLLLWLLGIPLPIIIILALFMHH